MATPPVGPVLITGCSTGIGRATAERLARAGHTVYATARRVETVADLEAAGCRTLALDVTDDASMVDAVATVEREHGAVGALVNNAGYGQEGPVEEIAIDDVRRQFETNVFGPLRLVQLAVPAMRRAGRGRIVNVSSMGGRMSIPGGGVYHASKFALEALSDALRFELRGFGIVVVVIEPGLITTSFGDTAVSTLPSPDGPYGRFTEAVAARINDAYDGPMGKLMATGPAAVAAAIERAITAGRPRTRYVITPAAKATLATKRFMPDRAWDAIMRRMFPQPG